MNLTPDSRTQASQSLWQLNDCALDAVASDATATVLRALVAAAAVAATAAAVAAVSAAAAAVSAVAAAAAIAIAAAAAGAGGVPYASGSSRLSCHKEDAGHTVAGAGRSTSSTTCAEAECLRRWKRRKC